MPIDWGASEVALREAIKGRSAAVRAAEALNLALRELGQDYERLQRDAVADSAPNIPTWAAEKGHRSVREVAQKLEELTAHVAAVAVRMAKP